MSLPKVVALFNGVHPAEYTVQTDLCTIGRSSDCHIIIPATLVSRLHAKIERLGLHYVLSDMDSTNGTFVNGQKLHEPHLLRDQDLIGLYPDAPALRFEDPDSTLAGVRLDGLLQQQKQNLPTDLKPSIIEPVTDILVTRHS